MAIDLRARSTQATRRGARRRASSCAPTSTAPAAAGPGGQGRGRHRSGVAHPRLAPRRPSRAGASSARRRGASRARPASRSGSWTRTTAPATTSRAGGAARSRSRLLVGACRASASSSRSPIPDDDGDLFAWAEGCGPLTRNGRPVAPLPPDALGPHRRRARVQRGRLRPRGQPRLRHPGPLPCGAQHRSPPGAGGGGRGRGGRLAQLALGLGLRRAATPCCAGRARRSSTSRAARWPTGPTARSRCVCAFGGRGGSSPACSSRPWHTLGMNARDREGEDFPVRLPQGRAEGDAGRLARAQGCLLGQLAGDNLGALVEFADGRGDRASATRTARAGSWTAAAGTSSPASRPTTRRWRSPWPGPSWRGAVRARGGSRGLPRLAALVAVRRGRDGRARPCATTRTPPARPTAR